MFQVKLALKYNVHMRKKLKQKNFNYTAAYHIIKVLMYFNASGDH